MSSARLVLLVVVAFGCVGVAPAGAVVGGQQVDPATVPWFASLPGCGGTLVAPDRVLTAAHCVENRTLADIPFVVVGGASHRTLGFSMHPNWRRRNGAANVVDDLALVMLAVPVAGVTPVPVGGPLAPAMTILGAGRQHPPGVGSEASNLDGVLRGASLLPLADRACARAYRRARGNDGERYVAASMLCATDVDGLAPLSSGCNGDSGGPLLSGPLATPRLVGVVSWGGRDCGARRLPSVFADVTRARSFVLAVAPVLAPLPRGAARVSGVRRVGGVLRCSPPGFTNSPERVAVQWLRLGPHRPPVVARGSAYRVRRADAGRRLACRAEGSNDGGRSWALSAPIRIRRR